MSKSTHQIAVKAVDQTAGAFGSIQARAAAASAKIRSMMGGAIAAAGAYLGFRAIKGGIDELGHLSDVAMKTSTSVGELTGAVNAMNVLGIQNMSVEQLAKSFDYMAKTTGRAGMAGLYQTIEELGKIPDAALRGQEAMRIFGRSGMEFMPLINAAKDGTNALQGVIDAMPRIPQAAADAGDAAADAMAMAGQGVKSVWYQVLGKIADWLNSTFGLGLRGAASAGVAYMEYFAKTAWRYVSGFFSAWNNSSEGMIGAWQAVSVAIVKVAKEMAVALAKTLEAPIQPWIDKIFAGWRYAWQRMTLGEEKALQNFMAYQQAMESNDPGELIYRAWKEYQDKIKDVSILPEGVEIDTSDLEKALEERVKVAAELDVKINDAAISLADRKAADKLADLDLAPKAPAIRNELMLGGSAKSIATAMLGPQLQSETKKQTKLLEKIAKNTGDTADNTDTDGEKLEAI